MGMPSGIELLVIALVILLLFGGKKIPELAKGLGSGIKNFKNAVKDDEKAVDVADAKESAEEIEDAKTSATTKSEDSQKA